MDINIYLNFLHIIIFTYSLISKRQSKYLDSISFLLLLNPYYQQLSQFYFLNYLPTLNNNIIIHYIQFITLQIPSPFSKPFFFLILIYLFLSPIYFPQNYHLINFSIIFLYILPTIQPIIILTIHIIITQIMQTQRPLNFNLTHHQYQHIQNPQIPLHHKQLKIKIKQSCRICLQESGNFINPCFCKGTVKWMHFECAKLWIKSLKCDKKKNYEFSNEYRYIICQLCNREISYVIQIQKICTKSKLLINLKQNYKFTILQLFILFILLFAFIFLLIILIQSLNYTGGFTLEGQRLIIYAIFQSVVGICFIMYLYSFIQENFISTSTLVSKILNNEEMEIIKNKYRLGGKGSSKILPL